MLIEDAKNISTSDALCMPIQFWAPSCSNASYMIYNYPYFTEREETFRDKLKPHGTSVKN